MGEIGGLLIMAVIWYVFRAIAAGIKKQSEAQRKAQREGAGDDYRYQPKPPEKSSRRGWGEWAEMLGKMVGGEEVAAPKDWRATTHPAFPPAPPPNPPTFGEVARSTAPAFTSLEGYAYPDEREELISRQPTREAPVLDARDFLPDRWDAPALVKGMIFTEVLTRPAQRRRPGMRRG